MWICFSHVPGAGGRRGWSAVVFGGEFQDYLKGLRKEGRGMPTNPILTPFFSSPFQPQPSGSRVESEYVATDPRVIGT